MHNLKSFRSKLTWIPLPPGVLFRAADPSSSENQDATGVVDKPAVPNVDSAFVICLDEQGSLFCDTNPNFMHFLRGNPSKPNGFPFNDHWFVWKKVWDLEGPQIFCVLEGPHLTIDTLNFVWENPSSGTQHKESHPLVLQVIPNCHWKSVIFLCNLKFNRLTFDGSEIRGSTHQLRLVVNIPLFTGFQHHVRWLALGFLNHQQYLRNLLLKSKRFW